MMEEEDGEGQEYGFDLDFEFAGRHGGIGGGGGSGYSLGGVKRVKGGRNKGGGVGMVGVREILAEFPGDHPVLRALRAVSRLSHAAFSAVWMAVVMVESFLGLLAKGGMFAVEVVCAMLDWVGADY